MRGVVDDVVVVERVDVFRIAVVVVPFPLERVYTREAPAPISRGRREEGRHIVYRVGCCVAGCIFECRDRGKTKTTTRPERQSARQRICGG